MHMRVLRFGLPLFLLLSLLFFFSFISSTSADTTNTNEIITKFKAARDARKSSHVATTTTTSDREAGAVEFEARRAALLAQAAQNAPLERDVEWEQQLLEDRRSVHFSRDRSIIDDDTSMIGTQTFNIAGIKPAEL